MAMQQIGYVLRAFVSAGLFATYASAATGDISNLGVLGSGTNSYGHSVNNSAQVVGYSNFASGNFHDHGFAWNGAAGSAATMVDLGTFGASDSYAIGINGSGQIARWSQTSGDATSRAFRYVGTPGSGVGWSYLVTISNTPS